jgi:hypothetical protein
MQPLNSTMKLSALLALALVSAPIQAQDSTGMHVSVHVPDSVAHIVDRESASHSRFTIVAQLTDRGLARMDSHEATDSIKGTANRIFARMAIGALIPLFDHGIAYHLRDLADARYADGRLQLLRANGDEVFRDVEIGKGPLMEAFSPADATAFARRAREARARLR